MPMPNRNVEGNYRYGYQGQYAEKEPELGTGINSFELRLWDSRIGRWLSPDPYGQFASPYLGMGNNPIRNVDPDGGFACDDCPNGTFEDGAEHISANGGTYIYEAEIGRWSDGAQITFTITPNETKVNNAAFVAALISRGTAVNTSATRLDGPLPIMDAAAAISQGMILTVAAYYTISNAFEDDYIVTTSRESPYMTLYRGVHTGHPDYANALRGTAVPRNFLDGHSDPMRHNAGNNNSIFTSWTISREVAEQFANSHGPGGLILMKRVRFYEPIPSVNLFNEGEFLMPGIVTGATVIGKPLIIKSF